jgi:hypothetical protein
MAAEKSYAEMMRASRSAQHNVAVGVVLDGPVASRKTLANVKKTPKRTAAKSRLRVRQDTSIVSVPRRVSERQRHIKRTASMAKKKTGKRNRLGHVVKANPRKRAKKRAAPKKRSAKRRSSGRSKAKRRAAMRKPAPRKISKRLKRAALGEFKARRRHRVRPYTRKAKSGRTARVKAHYSYEESAPNPRRRRRRARAREEVVSEMYTANPRKRAKKRKTARKNPRRKHATKRRKARRNPRRTARSASIPAVTRRRVRGRSVARPASVRIVLTDKRGTRSRRRSTKRRSYKKRGRGKRRSTRRYPRLPPASAMMENPLFMGEYGLENPMTGGEFATGAVMAGLGFVAASLVDRYIATMAGTAATGGPGTGGTLTDVAAIAAAPGITRILSQAVLAGVFIAPAHFVHHPMGKAALQGAGLGVGARLVGQLLEYFVIQKFFGLNSSGGVTAFGSRFYPAEINATTVAAQVAATPTASGALGVSGLGAIRRALPFGSRPQAQQRGVPQVRRGVAGPCGLNGGCGGGCGGTCSGSRTGQQASSALSAMYGQYGQGQGDNGNGDQGPPGFMPPPGGCAPCAQGQQQSPSPPVNVPVAPPMTTPPGGLLAGVGRVPVWIGNDE